MCVSGKRRDKPDKINRGWFRTDGPQETGPGTCLWIRRQKYTHIHTRLHTHAHTGMKIAFRNRQGTFMRRQMPCVSTTFGMGVCFAGARVRGPVTQKHTLGRYGK